jgi:hypothetical protein
MITSPLSFPFLPHLTPSSATGFGSDLLEDPLLVPLSSCSAHLRTGVLYSQNLRESVDIVRMKMKNFQRIMLFTH